MTHEEYRQIESESLYELQLSLEHQMESEGIYPFRNAIGDSRIEGAILDKQESDHSSW